MFNYLSQKHPEKQDALFNKRTYEFNLLKKQKHLPKITINSRISYLNKDWILETINNFFKEKYHFTIPSEFEINYYYQNKKGKTMVVVVCSRLKDGFLFAKGEGIDEYEATKNLLENFELELNIPKKFQETNTQTYVQALIGGDQYA